MTEYYLIEPVIATKLGMVIYALVLTDTTGKETERTFLSEEIARTEWAKLVSDNSAWSQAFTKKVR